MPIPEKIRSMPLNQFMADYKGDLSSVLPKVRRTRSKSRKSSISMFVTPSKSDVETPTRRRSLRLQTPSTVRRRRQGEITYSSNGSPIESEETSGMSVTKAKLFVMLDESDATHMNLLIKDNKTNLETQIDVSNENDLMLLKKNGKKEQAKLMVQEYKKKMQALCDEVMAKLDNE
ncbi:hypothetical protein Ae201684P_017976 [Aphanomyces euteiches]|nr:hypothetical protein Ae201684P_017976 [Aphanomyces euteiches]